MIWILCLFGVAILLIVENVGYINTEAYKKRCGNRIAVVAKLPKEEWEGLVIGSLQAYCAFDFSETDVCIENLSGNPQALSMCCSLALENCDRVKQGGFLLVCLPLAGLIFDDYKDDSHQEVFYSILHKPQVIRGYHPFKKFLYRYMPVLTSWKNFFQMPWEITQRLFRHFDRKEQIIENDLKEESKLRVKEWYTLTGVDVSKEWKSGEADIQIKKNISLLRKVFLEYRNKEINPVILTPPVTDTFYCMIAESFLEHGYIRPLRELADEMKIPFWDFCGERLYGDEEELFEGIDYLNKEGRKRFTKQVLEQLLKERELL